MNKNNHHWFKKIKSNISGYGLCSNRYIPCGTILLEYMGKRITTAEAESPTYKNNRYLLSLDFDKIIDGSKKNNIARFINHSCHPNCEAITSNKKVYIMNIKPIKKGEELTYDYNLESYQWITHCRCPSCQVIVNNPPYNKLS